MSFDRLLRGLAFFVAGLACAVLNATHECRAQSFLGRASSGQVTVQVLDVGQGDSILIRSPEGKTALIDAGPTRNGAYSALKRQGIKSIDLAVLSHHHIDHYGGMDAVVRAMKPRYFLVSNSGHATPLYLKLLKTVEAEEVTVIQPTAKPARSSWARSSS